MLKFADAMIRCLTTSSLIWCVVCQDRFGTSRNSLFRHSGFQTLHEASRTVIRMQLLSFHVLQTFFTTHSGGPRCILCHPAENGKTLHHQTGKQQTREHVSIRRNSRVWVSRCLLKMATCTRTAASDCCYTRASSNSICDSDRVALCRFHWRDQGETLLRYQNKSNSPSTWRL